MTTIRTDLQKKAQSDLVQYAIFRWEGAVILALSIVLAFINIRPLGFPAYGWLILGILGWVAIAYSSLTDREANAEILLKLFQEQYNPRDIRDGELRQKVENALEYQRRIETQIRQQKEGVMRDRLESTANQFTDWITNVYQLALRLDAYRRDDLLARERDVLPKEIEGLNARRRLESNAMLQEQLDQTIEAKGKHWASLRALDDRMKQARLQLDQSLTALATIYSQVQLVDAQSVGSGRAERLQEDIREQVNRLNDLVNSINEVYDYHTKGLG